MCPDSYSPEEVELEEKLQAEALLEESSETLKHCFQQQFANGEELQKGSYGRRHLLFTMPEDREYEPIQNKIDWHAPTITELPLEIGVFAKLSIGKLTKESPRWVNASKTLEDIGTVHIGNWEEVVICPESKYLNTIISNESNTPSWDRESMTARVEFEKKEGVPVTFFKEFPVEVQPPSLKNNRIIQVVVCETPAGKITHTIQLHPEKADSGYVARNYSQNTWGDYDISELKGESEKYPSPSEIRQVIRQKFERENRSSVWDEMGSNQISHSSSGAGQHGGDAVSITYTNRAFQEEVDYLVAQNISKETLTEIGKIPKEAMELGWSYHVPKKIDSSFENQAWPAVDMPIETTERDDNDRVVDTRPVNIDPLQHPGYPNILQDVISGMTAQQAVEKNLGQCRQIDASERQVAAAWLRKRHHNAKPDKYGRWAEVPNTINNPLLRERLTSRLEAQKEAFHIKTEKEKRERDMKNVEENWFDILKRDNWPEIRDLHEDAQDFLDSKKEEYQKKYNQIISQREEEKYEKRRREEEKMINQKQEEVVRAEEDEAFMRSTNPFQDL